MYSSYGCMCMVHPPNISHHHVPHIISLILNDAKFRYIDCGGGTNVYSSAAGCWLNQYNTGLLCSVFELAMIVIIAYEWKCRHTYVRVSAASFVQPSLARIYKLQY